MVNFDTITSTTEGEENFSINTQQVCSHAQSMLLIPLKQTYVVQYRCLLQIKPCVVVNGSQCSFLKPVCFTFGTTVTGFEYLSYTRWGHTVTLIARWFHIWL